MKIPSLDWSRHRRRPATRLQGTAAAAARPVRTAPADAANRGPSSGPPAPACACGAQVSLIAPSLSQIVQLSSLRCSAETLAFRRNAGARLRTIGSFPALRFLRSGSRNLRTTPFVDRAPGESQSRSCTERACTIRRMSRRAGRCIGGRMEGVLVDHYGGPEVLKVVEDADPRPGRGEVLVRVLAAGVSYTDAMLRVGSYLGVPKPPFTPGYELGGVVEELGPGCTEAGCG